MKLRKVSPSSCHRPPGFHLRAGLLSRCLGKSRWLLPAAVALLIVGAAQAQAQDVVLQAPWQENANGTLSTNIGWNYAMGYHFAPLVDGEIHELGGFFNGTKTVRLFEKSTGALLAEAQVTAANSWGYSSIKPIPVLAENTYTVAVYLAGSGASFHSGIDPLPQVYGDIRIEGSTYAYTGSDPVARPTNLVTTTMYGQADIKFAPGVGGPQCEGTHADLRVNGLEWRADHNEWQIKFNDCPQGSTCQVQLSLENIGSSTISMIAIDVDRDVTFEDYLILDHSCRWGLAPGATCPITLRYEMPSGFARTNPGALIIAVAKNRASGAPPDVTSVTFSPTPLYALGPDSVWIQSCAEDDVPGSDLCE